MYLIYSGKTTTPPVLNHCYHFLVKPSLHSSLGNMHLKQKKYVLLLLLVAMGIVMLFLGCSDSGNSILHVNEWVDNPDSYILSGKKKQTESGNLIIFNDNTVILNGNTWTDLARQTTHDSENRLVIERNGYYRAIYWRNVEKLYVDLAISDSVKSPGSIEVPRSVNDWHQYYSLIPAKDLLQFEMDYESKYEYTYRYNSSYGGDHRKEEYDGEVTLKITEESLADSITLQKMELIYDISRHYYYRGYADIVIAYTENNFQWKAEYNIVFFEDYAWIVDDNFNINQPSFENAVLVMEEVCPGSMFHPYFFEQPGHGGGFQKFYLEEYNDNYIFKYYLSDKVIVDENIGITEVRFSTEGGQSVNFKLVE